MNVLSISLLFILVFLSFLIPVLLRRHVWKRLSLAIAQDDFDAYFKVLDSFISKISFPAFYRENIRLSAYITQNKEELVKKQINFMETEMRLKREEKQQIFERAFYYFIDKRDKNVAYDILQKMKAEDSKMYDSMEIEYEILMEKKTSHIKNLEERIEQLETKKDPVKQEEINISIGYYKQTKRFSKMCKIKSKIYPKMCLTSIR